MQPIRDSKLPRAAPFAPPIGIVATPVAAIGTQPLAIVPAIAPPTARSSRTAPIALLVSAALLLFGLISRAWFNANVGLLGVDDASWFDVKTAPTALKLFSSIGIVGIVASIAFLTQSAAMLFKQQPQRVLMVPLNASLGVAAFGCFSFFFHLGFGDELAISYAGILTLAAIIGASVVVGALVRPLTKKLST